MTKMTAEMFGENTPIVPDEKIEEWLGDEPVMKMTKKEQIQKQIEELQAKLEEQEQQQIKAQKRKELIESLTPEQRELLGL